MNNDIRKELGMTQKEMADYLGIPVSSYAMYEQGERGLPRVGNDKFLQAVIFLHQQKAKNDASPTAIPHPEQAHTKSLKFFRSIIRDHKVGIALAVFKLGDLREKYIGICKTLQMTAATTVAVTEKTTQSIGNDLTALIMHRKLADCGLGKQAELEFKISVMEFEKKTAEEMVRRLDVGRELAKEK